MAYLTQDDLTGYLDEREVLAIKRDYEADNVDKLPIGITYAENYVSDRLGSRYDMAAEYAKTGANRNTTLMGVIASIAIWKLGLTFPTIQLDGKRHFEYEQALKDLNDIATGKLLGNVLPTPTAGTSYVGVAYGTNENFEVNY